MVHALICSYYIGKKSDPPVRKLHNARKNKKGEG